ncbi:Dolichol kinase [Nymphaea thermarum]|nr:Dolichol kinase [Nymphaea thermarum]
MAAGVWSGERVVVFLVIIQVLSSIASSWLLWEAMALVLLAVGGLLVEIFVDGSEFTHFQSRRGASSGILLGTVSIPLVMLSRLIQLSSGLTSQEVGSESAMSLESELAYLNIQYWSASVGGLVVLIFLSSLLSSQKGSRKLWDLRYALFSVFYFVLYATFCCLSLAARFHTSEAMLAASGLVLYLSDALLYTVVKANSLSSLQYGTRRSQVDIIIQGALVSLLLFPMLYKFVLQTWSFFSSHTDADVRDNVEHRGLSERLHKAIAFYALLTLVLTVFAPAWMYFVHNFEIHPILWRKYFIYTILLSSQPEFLDLAFGVALAVFLTVEIIRASMVGHKYGVLRWSKAGKKTVEGTAAGITSVLLACSVLLPLLASTGYFLSQHWLSLMIAVSLSGLLEAYTAQLDNAFIPLVFYSLLCVT